MLFRLKDINRCFGFLKGIIELRRLYKYFGDVLLSCTASFLLFLYAPTLLYISNELDFSFDIYDVWHHMASVALIAFLASILFLTLLRLISERLEHPSYFPAMPTRRKTSHMLSKLVVRKYTGS